MADEFELRYVVQRSGKTGGEQVLEEPPRTAISWLGQIVSRETVEQIAMAIILAFLFRAFLAEAFIIPTGSMAPTLMGRHVDLACPQCGHRFEGGASGEEPQDPRQQPRSVIASFCNNCRYLYPLDPAGEAVHRSYSGDRILVSKLAYGFREPKRWDVIVFKFPDDAKENYIKRLIGLPNELITIFGGDIYTGKSEQTLADIARKPPAKIKEMLQLVHDTKQAPAALYQAGFPLRWQPQSANWKSSSDGKSFVLANATKETSWLHYQHILPSPADWKAVTEKKSLEQRVRSPRLITDFYAYNAHVDHPTQDVFNGSFRPGWDNSVIGEVTGSFWVGDLAVAADIELAGSQGDVVLELIEAGRHHTCRVDVSSGVATLQIDRGEIAFEQGATVATGQTSLQGAGRYRLRLANVDNRLVFWVNDKVVKFDTQTDYHVPPREEIPKYSSNDPGDLAPARVGVANAPLTVHRLQVMRDVYYIATDVNSPMQEYDPAVTQYNIFQAFSRPELWETSQVFRGRRAIHFKLEEDQFFPMGDNSPQSYDGRSWIGGNFVERRLLIGKALAVFWPHTLRRPVPFFPNFRRMRWIR